jgi:hypothetical protein
MTAKNNFLDNVGQEVSSAWLNEVATNSNAVPGKVTGLSTGVKLWAGTQAAYDAIPTKDPNGVYVVSG